MPEYHSLTGYVSVALEALKLPRAQALAEAVARHPDARLVEVLQFADGLSREALVIDLDCDAVPSRSASGIRSPERFALVVGEDGPGRPPAVYALRKGFPDVMHLNEAQRGQPRSLCLYFEPPRAVMRTWTPERHLARVQWWMRGSAAGTLHTVDQPVEQPFFESGLELVLPSNLDAMRASGATAFHVVAIEPHHREGTFTMRLQVGARGGSDKQFEVMFVDCQPLEHGTRTSVPETLGALADELAPRGINLAATLRTSFAKDMAAAGERVAGSPNKIVLILSIPIVRKAGEAVEDVQRMAFLSLKGRLELGVELGAYFNNNGTVSNVTLLSGALPEEKDWRSVQTVPAQVLTMPDSAALRRYSGIEEAGPQAGLLVGTGALGSELLNLWVRCGWGRWSAVDSDHLKPHNLARHQGFGFHVGKPKVAIAKELADIVSDQPALHKVVVADVCESAETELAGLLEAADLVVDCSTTLDFPRLTSRSERAGRHASVFLTPSGNGSVLLLEDKARGLRLLTLEAQYYRAVLEADWGRGHLVGHQGTFWSGASCRDISYRLAHSTVVSHAGNLAEQLRRQLAGDEASIRVWERDPNTGGVSPYTVPAHAPVHWKLGGFTVYADEGLLAKLRALRSGALPTETGGVLLGYHDLNLKEIVIVDVLPAPSDSKQSRGHFERGVEGLMQEVAEVQRRTANVVGYLGEWHSHPRGHSAKASGDDVLQLLNLSQKMAEEGLPFLQLIVGEKDVQVYVGQAL